MLKMEWDPQDPRGKSPKAGQPGHFDHHDWLRDFAVEAHAVLMAQEDRIKFLEDQLVKLTTPTRSRTKAPEVKP